VPSPTWPQRILLLAFGGFLVLLVELALRIAGFGGAPPLLVPVLPPGEGAAAGARLHEVYPRAADLFFHRPGPHGERLVGGHRRELLEVPKPPGTVRVLFLGASSVEGFPLPRNLTSSRFLQARLRDALPDHRVEVVNLGVTAVASFPVRRLALAALEVAEPDVVLLYAGHNEHFGASGVASLQTFGRRVTTMRLVDAGRRTALFQGAVELARPSEGDEPSAPQHLIEVMAGLPAIEPAGKLHRAAEASLVANLEAVIEAARRHGVPVVLATLASNTRGFAPVAFWEEGLETPAREDLRAHLEAAGELAGREPGRAAEQLEALAERHPLHAGVAWELARALEALESPRAAEWFRRARDLDAMPWRATSAANQALRELAQRRELPLADAEAAFDRDSGGAPGWELFYDHVHPSLRGQSLLADTLFEAMVAAGLLGLEPGAGERTAAWQEVAAALGANPLEHFLVADKMARLFRLPPIGAHNQAAAQRFAEQIAAIERQSAPVEAQAIRRWRRASRQAGMSLPISFFGASSALAAGDLELAGRYSAAAAGNALELSDEEIAARYMSLRARLPGNSSAGAAELEQALARARLVELMEGQPSALLADALAGMLRLAAAAEAARYDSKARELEPATAPVTRAFLDELRWATASRDHRRRPPRFEGEPR
jgi:lysophospholipase L1-like esterase